AITTGSNGLSADVIRLKVSTGADVLRHERGSITLFPSDRAYTSRPCSSVFPSSPAGRELPFFACKG
ncbi:MAG: hypothetical protein WBA25_12620, partial [Jannaschia sp.]